MEAFIEVANVHLIPLGQETITEDEEIMRVHDLLKQGYNELQSYDPTSALKLFKEASEIDPSNADILVAKAHAFIELGEYENAISEANTLLSQPFSNNPKCVSQGLYIKALSYECSNDFPSAVIHFCKLFSKQSQFPGICDSIVRAAAPLTGIDLFSISTENFTETLASLAHAMYESAHLNVAQSLIECVLHYETSVDSEVLARVFLCGARIMRSNSELDKAISAYQQSISHVWKLNCVEVEVEARTELASLHMSRRDFLEAACCYEQLLSYFDTLDKSEFPEFNENLPLVIQNICRCFIELEEFDSAFRYAEMLRSYIVPSEEETPRKHDKRFSSAHEEISAIINFKSGDAEKSLLHCENFLSLERELNERLLHALCLIGRISRKSGDFERSSKFFRECISLCLENDGTTTKRGDIHLLRALYQHGKVSLLLGNFEEAEERFIDVIKQSKSLPDRNLECKSLLQLADCCTKKKEYSNSFYHLESALQMEKEIDKKLVEVCRVKCACISQHVGSASELQRARTTLEAVLSDLQQRALDSFGRLLNFENKACRLFFEACDALVHISGKLNDFQQALVFSETSRRFKFMAFSWQKVDFLLPRFQSYANMLHCPLSITDIVTILDQEEKPVVYFHLAPDFFYAWVITPKQGVIRFHKHSKETSKTSLYNAISELRANSLPSAKEKYNFENRVILDSSKPVPNVTDADRSREEIIKDLEYFLLDPLAECLNNIPAMNQMIAIWEGLFDMVPMADFIEKGLNQRLKSESGVSIQVYHCLESLRWLKFLDTGKLVMPAEDPAVPQMSKVRKPPATQTTAASLFRDNEDKELQELPALMFQRQIHSAVDSELASLYKDRLPSDIYTAYSTALAENESIPTETSSAKQRNDPSQLLTRSERLLPRTNERHDVTSDKSGGHVQYGPRGHVIDSSFTGIISCTWNKSNVKSSKIAVASYDPSDKNELINFVGAPLLPPYVELRKYVWRPLKLLRKAQEELKTCAAYFKGTAIMGEMCTREEAIGLFQRSTCIHLATYVEYANCVLAFTPDKHYQAMDRIKSGAACIHMRDLLDMDLSHVKLLVLSSFPPRCYASPDYMNLLVLFSALGVRSIVYSTQAVRDDAALKFYSYFYRAIKKITPMCSVSQALQYAKEHMRKNSEFCKDSGNYATFQVFGQDVKLSGSNMVHDMLDAIVDHVEKSREVDPLNIAPNVAMKPEESLAGLRKVLANLVIDCGHDLDFLEESNKLICGAIRRLEDSSVQHVERVSEKRLISDERILRFIHLIGFDFQPVGVSLEEPMVVFPHWDKQQILVPAREAIQGIISIKDSWTVVEELCNLLKMCNTDESAVCAVIDILSLSEHAPDIQLFISDAGVRKAWLPATPRRLLKSVGFHQISTMLMPYRSVQNVRYQQGVFRVLCALVGVKGDAMLRRVDNEFLGRDGGGSEKSGDESSSQSCVAGPTSQIVLPIQWRMQIGGSSQLSPEQIKQIAQSIDAVKTSYDGKLSDFIRKHRSYLDEQGDQYLDETFGIVPERLDKVKVEAGGTPSMTRAPLGLPPPPLKLQQVEQRREYAHFLFSHKKQEVALHRDDDIRNIVLSAASLAV